MVVMAVGTEPRPPTYKPCLLTTTPLWLTISTNHAKILPGLKDKKLCSKLAESKAKNGTTWHRSYKMLLRWPSALRDIEDIPSHPLRSIRQWLTAAKILIATNITKPTKCTQDTQHCHTKPKKIKGWEYQGDHLKKDCPTVNTSQGKSKHSRLQDNKERQHTLFKSFQKKFPNKKESINEVAEAFDDNDDDDDNDDSEELEPVLY